LILKRLIIENIGPFYGKYEITFFDDKLSEHKPLILIYGRNGSGKTTIFDSIQLGLYGRSFIQQKKLNISYEEMIRSKLNQKAMDLYQNFRAKIDLEFILSFKGKFDVFRLVRSWKFNGNKLNEALSVYYNDKLTSDLETDYWQNLIREILPPEVTSFYFIDGEKIQKLVNRFSEKYYLRNLFNKLFGLELLEKLDKHINFYLRKKMKNNSEISFEVKYEKLEEELAKHIHNLEELLLIKEKLLKEKKVNIMMTSKIEKELTMNGGNYIENIASLKAKLEVIQRQKKTISRKIREACQGMAPLVLAKKIVEQTRKQLIAENNGDNSFINHNGHKEIIKTMKSVLENSKTWRNVEIDNKNREILSKNIELGIKESFNRKIKTIEEKTIHSLTKSETNQLIKWLDLTRNYESKDILALFEKKRKLHKREEVIRKNINLATEQKSIQDTLNEIKEYYRELSNIETELAVIEKKIEKERIEINKVKKKFNKLLTKKTRFNAQLKSIEYAISAKNVVEEFSAKLTKKRIKSLKSVFLDNYRKLSPLAKRVERIELDTTNFELRLLDISENLINKYSFSAGEKQIYSMTLLWSLAKLSNKTMPLIIDTPLGRLDSIHRKNLTHEFFLKASKQIIVFSTDTEFNSDALEEIKPFISMSYKLLKDENEETSRVVKLDNYQVIKSGNKVAMNAD